MAGVSSDQRSRWLRLIAAGVPRLEASQIVGENSSTFRILQIEDLEFRASMIEALEAGKKVRKLEQGREISRETREELLELVRGGMRPSEACQELGFYYWQVVQVINPLTSFYDREFHDEWKLALKDGQPQFLDRLHRLAIKQAENGDYRPLRDLLLVHDPDYKPLLTKRLEVGNIGEDAFRMAAMAAIDKSKLTDEELDNLIALLEKAQPAPEIEKPEEEPARLELVSGNE